MPEAFHVPPYCDHIVPILLGVTIISAFLGWGISWLLGRLWERMDIEWVEAEESE